MANKPSWSDAPPKATHLAMDEDGDWYWYLGEPIQNSNGLWVGRIIANANPPEKLPDWTTTLEPRPDPANYCGHCGGWIGGPMICCEDRMRSPIPNITKAQSDALRERIAAAPKLAGGSSD